MFPDEFSLIIEGQKYVAKKVQEDGADFTRFFILAMVLNYDESMLKGRTAMELDGVDARKLNVKDLTSEQLGKACASFFEEATQKEFLELLAKLKKERGLKMTEFKKEIKNILGRSVEDLYSLNKEDCYKLLEKMEVLKVLGSN